jgi:hypothetical protein
MNDQVNEDGMRRACRTHTLKEECTYGMLMGKIEGKIQVGRPKLRWEVNIKMDFKEIKWGIWTGFI